MLKLLFFKHKFFCWFSLMAFAVMHPINHFIFSIETSITQSPKDSGLEILEAKIRKELLMINFPSRSWILKTKADTPDAVLDVAIVGGGMGGMAAALALKIEGITNIKIFDENTLGQEGPWNRYARMNMLRSSKTCLGPALGIPSLTFWSWYEAQYGEDNWKRLKTVPTNMWGQYLCWFRRVLELPVENGMTLLKLTPFEGYLELAFNHEGQEIIIFARKVVLATGREGSGGYEIPKFMDGVSKTLYAHTGENIDPQSFANKRIAIVGAGASSFDAAATALENGAESVEIIVRRDAIPQVNKFNQFYYPGIAHGFYSLPDELHCEYFAEAFECGAPPPKDALDRVKGYSNLRILYNTEIHQIGEDGRQAMLRTSQKDFGVDLIILATGYAVDLSRRHELDGIQDFILTWENRLPEEFIKRMPKLGRFPYLGPHFEFLELENGTANFLKDIYCFNYGAFLSHGLLSGDIALIGMGARRLAEGITKDFFISDSQQYLDKYKNPKSPIPNPLSK